jgi:HSP20 family protein
MKITKWEPFGGLDSFRREMDCLFDSFFGPTKTTLPTLAGQWTPRVDVVELDAEISVKVDVPGMEEKDLFVSVSGDDLVVKGERKLESEEKKKQYHRVERSYGMFHRVIPLPSTIEAGKIKAEYNKGVLEIHLPKKAGAKAKQIPIGVKK